jgi:UDP:flavonoid glycosyltransferase YjiC (YdhE family)
LTSIENIPHALFTSAPFFGHRNPLLLQADELVRRGWKISVASFEEARPIVSGHCGLTFRSLGPSGVDPATIDELRNRITLERSFVRGMQVILNTLGQGWLNQYDRLLEILRRERPDVLIAAIRFICAGTRLTFLVSHCAIPFWSEKN